MPFIKPYGNSCVTFKTDVEHTHKQDIICLNILDYLSKTDMEITSAKGGFSWPINNIIISGTYIQPF